jgi:hypothetical protein
MPIRMTPPVNQPRFPNEVKDQFLRALVAHGETVVTMTEIASKSPEPGVRQLFERLGQAGRDVYLLQGVGLINVHVRSTPPGWWNIQKSVKTDLDDLHEALSIDRVFVLLIGRKDQFIADGYIAADFEHPPFVRPPGEGATKYSINEKQHLNQAFMFLSLDKVAEGLLTKFREEEKVSGTFFREK